MDVEGGGEGMGGMVEVGWDIMVLCEMISRGEKIVLSGRFSSWFAASLCG